jgi:DNA helicase-2/ATP-dependent DNA helicase PcrA
LQVNYLESLNPEQKKAVLATDGPVLIVAGAGAGKTKTITHRILHLIVSGVPPERILAITFTNKAAREMRERVREMIEKDRELAHLRNMMPFMSTFHSLGVKIIKENAELLKLPRHFNIFDTADSKKALKDALSAIGVDPKEHLDKVRHVISAEKSRGISASEYLERAPYDYTSELVKKAWPKYEETLKKESALDFDDLLLKTLKIFKTHPDVLRKYQERFLYIHIDEYQDTNKVQNEIVEMLAAKHRNICVVGDTDQNIYSWRGAEIKNMLHFERTYPDVQTFFLERNYRSTKNILAVANEIIEKNTFRIPKKLFTENGEGEKIGVFRGRNEVDEAHFIALTCKGLIEGGTNPDEIAVLYRANFQSRVLEDAFLSYNVPYQLLGTKFFERKEVKDVMSYVRAALNPDALSDFSRIVNIPPRGIGKVTVEKILTKREDELSSAVRLKIDGVRRMLQDFENILLAEKPSESIKYIVKRSGIEDMYRTGLEEDTERLENVMELVTLAKKYDSLPQEEAIEGFLTDTALASDQDEDDGSRNGVRLMTVHASKGLEFQYVFICGLEADLFPHKKLSEGRRGEDGEEERRLFYVAVTRAGKKLYLTHAETRTIFGSLEVNAPSEFMDDIPAKYTETVGYGGIEEAKAPLFSIDF